MSDEVEENERMVKQIMARADTSRTERWRGTSLDTAAGDV
jgi:hypothetical protein